MNGTKQNETIHLFVIEYEDQRGHRYRTVVEALSLEAARRQFRRDNPDVELLSCV